MTKEEILFLHKLAHRPGVGVFEGETQETMIRIIEALGGSARPNEVKRILTFVYGEFNGVGPIADSVSMALGNGTISLTRDLNDWEGWLSVNA